MPNKNQFPPANLFTPSAIDQMILLLEAQLAPKLKELHDSEIALSEAEEMYNNEKENYDLKMKTVAADKTTLATLVALREGRTHPLLISGPIIRSKSHTAKAPKRRGKNIDWSGILCPILVEFDRFVYSSDIWSTLIARKLVIQDQRSAFMHFIKQVQIKGIYKNVAFYKDKYGHATFFSTKDEQPLPAYIKEFMFNDTSFPEDDEDIVMQEMIDEGHIIAEDKMMREVTADN